MKMAYLLPLLSSAIFEVATRCNRDSHIPARDYAKEIYCLLIQHSDFWSLYMTLVPEQDRNRINRLLDEIRKVKGDSRPRLQT